ncbi:MAG: zf-TFIIB domain-containing protein [Proteobacteria bacterium]|nr:zf-TFIIB domain-containing protein [Pseudomonadota bacterium]
MQSFSHSPGSHTQCPRCGQSTAKVSARISQLERGHVQLFECTNCGMVGELDGHVTARSPHRNQGSPSSGD